MRRMGLPLELLMRGRNPEREVLKPESKILSENLMESLVLGAEKKSARRVRGARRKSRAGWRASRELSLKPGSGESPPLSSAARAGW